jgi:hypothetical protein
LLHSNVREKSKQDHSEIKTTFSSSWQNYFDQKFPHSQPVPARRLPRHSPHRQRQLCVGPPRLEGAERHHEGFLHATGRSRFHRLCPSLYHGKVADNIADATMFLNERAGQADRGIAVIGFSEKSEVAGAIICPESREEHAILHINTEDSKLS